VHGWGPYSPVGTIIAATEPDAPDEPTLSVTGTDVVISWSEPANTGGTAIAITAYKIELPLADGTYKEDLVSCDGSQAAIVAALSCTIPMTTLTSNDASTGFGYTQGHEVTARVTAINIIGEGEAGPTSSSSTVLAQVVPHAPATGPARALGTDEGEILLEWDSLTAPYNGGSAVTSYNLQWDQGSGIFGQDLTGVSTNYLLTTYTHGAAIVAGASYRFRYRAANKFGWGAFSPVVTI
jgi:hypothetical protein